MEGPVLQHQLPGLDDELAAVPSLHYGVGEANQCSVCSRYPAPVTPALLFTPCHNVVKGIEGIC